jgi:hypothetical protein
MFLKSIGNIRRSELGGRSGVELVVILRYPEDTNLLAHVQHNSN